MTDVHRPGRPRPTRRRASPPEDAVERAARRTDCTRNCQAQNRVRGRLAVLGLPSHR
jgi:hypothetical protein